MALLGLPSEHSRGHIGLKQIPVGTVWNDLPEAFRTLLAQI